MNHKHSVMMRTCLCLCLVLLGLPLQAQSVLRGRVEDEQQNSVAGAAVRVLTADSAFVKGAASHSDGTFAVAGLPAGRYILSVSCIGYAGRSLNFEMPASDYALPPIVLKEESAMLKGVTVTGSAFIRKKDRVLIIPDRQQVKHASTGYDLLSNLMIPGIDVDRRKGTVSTLGGSVSLYINGRKVDQREVKNLRPKDIEKIEYFDAPTGKYAGDVASINYIVKEYKAGGYVTLDGDQTLGYVKGDYNAAAKIAHGNTSYSLFAGYNMRKYDNGHEEQDKEDFLFPGGTVTKESSTDVSRVKNNGQYVQLNVVNQNKKRTLSAKASFVRSDDPGNDQEESVRYSALYDAGRSASHTEQESLMPSLDLYGNFQLRDNQYLEVSLTGSYTDNTYNRRYTENDFSSRSGVKENLYTLTPSVKYVASLKHQNTIGAQLMHYYRMSSSTYTGDYTSWQHLWSGETLLFLNYNQRLGKKVFVDGRAGMSVLQYSLHGHEKYTYVSPRATILWGFQLSNRQQLYVGGAVGNAYPEISTLSSAEQTVDLLHIKRGNPDLDKINMYTVSSNYSLQFGRFNLFGIFMYEGEIHAALPDFFTEGGKLVETYRSDGDLHHMRAGIDLTWRVLDALQVRLSGRWQYGLITGTTRDSQNSVYGRLNINYYWKDFAFNVHGQTQSRLLSENGVHEWSDGGYGAYASWYHGNWALEAGTENPFITNSKTRYFLKSDVYHYDRTLFSRLNRQSAYVKISYTFDFGKKTSRDEKNIDTTINSAILKAE